MNVVPPLCLIFCAVFAPARVGGHRSSEKLENRNRRSSLGFLISWNGFTSTVTKEMLRGSREETLIVPITGEEIRAAVRNGDFLKELVACWDRAVTL